MRAALGLLTSLLAFSQSACQTGEPAHERGARANLLITTDDVGDAGAGDLAIAIEVDVGCDEACLEGERCSDGECVPATFVPRGECWGGQGGYGTPGASLAQCEYECRQHPACAGYSWNHFGEGLSNTYNCWLIVSCEVSSDQSWQWQTFCHDSEVCFNP
jgi:hypothetical protein